MGIFERTAKLLRFDESSERFELKEKEQGIPNPGTRWTDAAARKTGFPEKIKSDISKNEKLFRSLFSADVNKDLIFRRFSTGAGTPALLIYMNGMARDEVIARFIIDPMMRAKDDGGGDPKPILETIIRIPESTTETETGKIVKAILSGKTALMTDGFRSCMILETRGYEKRPVTQAENEKIVRGPQEGFSESMRTNITLIRRIIRTNDLVAEYSSAGGENGTDLAIVYRDGVTAPELIVEIKKRLAAISTDTLVCAGVIEQMIEDSAFSPLPQTLATERPDRTASFLMHGAAAVISEGSPYVLVMPATLSALLGSPEDIYLRRPLGTVIRVVRYVGAFASIFLPGYFIALAMYHQGLLSTEVLSTVIKSREMVFEPLPYEMLLLLFIFQLIREAGMRVPSSVGQAIGVIGGLILGQAAVAANLASTVVLIIVAISGLGNLCIPDYSTQVAASYFRFAFVIAAWMGGLLGLCSALIIAVGYTASLKSFGVPFLSPFAPKTGRKRPFILRGKIENHHRGEDYLNTEADKTVRTGRSGRNR